MTTGARLAAIDHRARAQMPPGGCLEAMRQAFHRSLRFDPRHPEDWLAWTIRVALLATGLLSPFAGFDAFLGASLVALAALGLLLMSGVAMVEAYRPRLMRLVEASVGFLFLMNWVGHYFDLYGGTTWFDFMLHAVGGLLGGLCGYWIARATRLFWLRGELAPFQAFWVVLSAALVMGALFEVAEFAADELLGAQTQRSPGQTAHEDTMTDIIAEAGTGLVVGLAAAWWTRARQRRRGPTAEEHRHDEGSVDAGGGNSTLAAASLSTAARDPTLAAKRQS